MRKEGTGSRVKKTDLIVRSVGPEIRSPGGFEAQYECCHRQNQPVPPGLTAEHVARVNTAHRWGVSARVVVYVDGFNLYFGLKSRGYKRYYWLDVSLMASHFLRPDQALVGVNYFTADITDPPHKRRRQQTLLDALETHTPTKIIRGRYLTKHRQCRQCGSVMRIPEEKKTDSAISAMMVADAFTDQFDIKPVSEEVPS